MCTGSTRAEPLAGPGAWWVLSYLPAARSRVRGSTGAWSEPESDGRWAKKQCPAFLGSTGASQKGGKNYETLEASLKDPPPHTHTQTHLLTHSVGCTSLRALGLLQEGDVNGPGAS